MANVRRIVGADPEGDPNVRLVELDDPNRTKVRRPVSSLGGGGGGGSNRSGDSGPGLEGDLASAFERAVQGGRFEGIGREQGREARARAQLQFEEQQAGGALNDARSRFAQDQANLLRRQREEEDTALEAFRRRVEGLERPTDIFRRLEDERDVPGIRERTKGLRSRVAEAEELLGALPEDVTARTAGTLTTEAQRRRILAREQVPITENLQTLSRTLGIESGNLADALAGITQQAGLEVQSQERLLEPDRIKIAALSDRAARELTAFSQERETELNILMDKLQRTRDLSDREFQRAAELARQEREFAQLSSQLEREAQLQQESQERGFSFQREQNDLDRQLRRFSGGGSQPAAIRTFDFFRNLNPDDRDLFLRLSGQGGEPTSEIDQIINERILRSLQEEPTQDSSPSFLERAGDFFRFLPGF